MKPPILFIDGDIMVYSIGFAIEKREKQDDGTYKIFVEPVHHAYHLIKNYMQGLFNKLETEIYELYITASNDKSNFRYKIDPEYKNTRKDARKPIFYNEIRNYLVEHWGAKIVSGAEADDMLGVRLINQRNTHRNWPIDIENTQIGIIVSLDKDLNNIPGHHYNTKKEKLYYIRRDEAVLNFYIQLLTGDRVDAIIGVSGIGPKRAYKLLKDCKTEEELYKEVLKAYKGNAERLLKNGQLLWISQNKLGELWQPPTMKK